MIANLKLRIRSREKTVLAELRTTIQKEYIVAADRLADLFGELLVLQRRLDLGEPPAAGRLFFPAVGTVPEREPGAYLAWMSFSESPAATAASTRLDSRINPEHHHEPTKPPAPATAE